MRPLALERPGQRKEAEVLCVLQPSTVYINLLLSRTSWFLDVLRGAFLPSTYRTVMEWDHGLAGCLPTSLTCCSPSVPHTKSLNRLHGMVALDIQPPDQ
jgi:hypothetical protein